MGACTGGPPHRMTYLHLIDPIALQAPAFELLGRTFQPAVHWYGLMYALAFLAGIGLNRLVGGVARAQGTIAACPLSVVTLLSRDDGRSKRGVL